MSNYQLRRNDWDNREAGRRDYYTHWEVEEEMAEDEADEDDDDKVRRLARRSANNESVSLNNQRYDDHHISNEGWRVRGMPPDDHLESDDTEVGAVSRNGNVLRGQNYVGSRSNSSVPHLKFNVEFDYEDTVETSSSASFSSAFGRSDNSRYKRPRENKIQWQRNQNKRQTANPPSQSSQIKFLNPDPDPHIINAMSKPIYHGGTGSGRGRAPEIPEKFRDDKDGSEIYVMDSYLKPPPSVYGSHYSGKSRAPSEMSSVKTKTSRKGGVVVETMSAPNPCCPNTKGVCCLLLLVNLGLILVTLGFSIVLQLYDPPFVWYCGIVFLIFGFIALIVSLILCVHLCRESEEARRQGSPGEMYWTHHWQKRIPIPGMSREVEKADDVSTVYSTRNERDEDKYYGHGREDRRGMTPIHTYGHH